MIEGIRRNAGWITVVVLFSVVTKWCLIHFGYPFMTHVDEWMILKDPLRWSVLYANGDLSKPTNLLNWLYIAWTGLLFVGGWLTGHWHDMQGFRQYLLSESISYLLWGRVLSLLLSTAANVVLTLLMFRITKDRVQRAVFVLLFILDPFELNANNFIKYDALSYLFYAVILYQVHGYFMLREHRRRALLYLTLFLAVSARIENIGFLIGVLVIDLFAAGEGASFRERLRLVRKPCVIGTLAYLLVTMYPVVLAYHWLGPAPDPHAIRIANTFEQVILRRFPHDLGSLWTTISRSRYYVWCTLALFGPVIPALFLLSLRDRSMRALHIAAAVISIALLLDAVKNTFYLLALSTVMLFTAIVTLQRMKDRRTSNALALFTLLWAGSFTGSFLLNALGTGDLRIQAYAYVLDHTAPNDLIYTNGIFTGIPQAPPTLRAMAKAIREEGGSTGLTLDHQAAIADSLGSRRVMSVLDYDFFNGTRFQGVFNNWYDPVQFVRDDPKYCVVVLQRYDQEEQFLAEDFSTLGVRFPAFYRALFQRYHLEQQFSYHPWDPRLKYRNYYYFHSTLIFRRNGT